MGSEMCIRDSIPGAESLTFQSRGFSAGEPINVELKGQSFNELQIVSDRLKELLSGFSGVFDIADTLADGKEEIQIELKPQGHLLDLSCSDIVGQVSQAFNGFQAQRIQRGRDDVRVIVRLPLEERSSCLLYTSPSPRDLSTSRMPSSA